MLKCVLANQVQNTCSFLPKSFVYTTTLSVKKLISREVKCSLVPRLSLSAWVAHQEPGYEAR